MKNLLLGLMIIFSIILGLGASFMSVGFFNYIVNDIMVVVGLIGVFATAKKYCKVSSNNNKESITFEDEEFKTFKNAVEANKLKDNGTDIDRQVKILKENDIELSDNKPL